MPARIIVTKERKCGRRKEGGVYLVGGEEGSPDGVLERFNQLNPPIPYQVTFHRGPRLVDANMVLARQPLETWWTGSSQDTEQKKSADKWALDMFGMTLEKRLVTGETRGTKSADEAMAILLNKLHLNRDDKRLVDYFRELTLNKVQELPRVAEHYNSLHESLAIFVMQGSQKKLLQAQGAIWRIAYNVPPSKRSLVIPTLTRFLVLLGLTKDATSMTQLFKE